MSNAGGRTPKPTAADLIRTLRVSDGMTVAQIAAECDRNPSLLYQVMAGKRRGDNLIVTLQQLTKGVVRTRPPRRKGKDGLEAKIRGTEGATAPPPATPTVPKRGHYSETRIYMRDRSTSYQISTPKSPGKGRNRASRQVTRRVAETVVDGRRAAFRVHFADNTTRMLGDKGGYHAETLWDNIGGQAADPFPWLKDELNRIAKRVGSPEIDSDIIGVDVTVFSQPDPPGRTPGGVKSFLRDERRAEVAERADAIAQATEAHRKAQTKVEQARHDRKAAKTSAKKRTSAKKNPRP